MVTSFSRGSVPLCPECDEIIGVDDGYACASCGREFHLECLDPHTLTCLYCAFSAQDDGPDDDLPDEDDE